MDTDLNRLFFEHQVALMRAAHSQDSDDRRRLNAEADGIASLICEYQVSHGADFAPLLPAEAL